MWKSPLGVSVNRPRTSRFLHVRSVGFPPRTDLGLIERLSVPGGWLYTANLSQFRVVYHLNRRTFLRAILRGRGREALDVALRLHGDGRAVLTYFEGSTVTIEPATIDATVSTTDVVIAGADRQVDPHGVQPIVLRHPVRSRGGGHLLPQRPGFACR